MYRIPPLGPRRYGWKRYTYPNHLVHCIPVQICPKNFHRPTQQSYCPHWIEMQQPCHRRRSKRRNYCCLLSSFHSFWKVNRCHTLRLTCDDKCRFQNRHRFRQREIHRDFPHTFRTQPRIRLRKLSDSYWNSSPSVPNSPA